ncbi:hypothetical protein THITH_04635 [Thioalkalivibrio paradoxus ARh 1]|uniref:Uncharacterized protein n=1 Tax=Thioalkalivibrio paradoxus ARh 1 TaxID=713585 RepID=W0DSH7_9GAMM|nr:hypothetical protein THITH_04635 [Thioalkalivibrio paradoxus ARh 1]
MSNFSIRIVAGVVLNRLEVQFDCLPDIDQGFFF